MASESPPNHGSPVTIAEVVGGNVTMARENRGWDQDRLVDEAAYVDLPWDKAVVTRIENGSAALTVADLLSLATLLGVAPHLLLYPPAGSAVALHLSGTEEDDSADLEDAVFYTETHMPAGEFADWLWDPDGHTPTLLDVAERELWSNASTPPRTE